MPGVYGKGRKGKGVYSGAPVEKADGGGGGFNPVMGVLQALDVGRRGVVAGVKELDDLVVTPYEKKRGGGGDGASLGDLKENFGAHIGAGDLISPEAYGGGSSNLRRAIGFAGDVALDPLSYVTLGASKAGTTAGRTITKSDLARTLLKEAAEQGDEGLAVVASRVAKKGTGTLSAEEAAAAGIRQGARIGLKNAKVTIPGTGAAARGINAVTGPLKALPYAAPVERALQAIDPQNKLSRTGLPRAEAFGADGPLKRLLLQDQTRLARGEARGMAHAARKNLDDIASRHKDVDPEDLRRILQGEAPAAPAAAQAADELRKLMDGVRSSTSALAGREIGHVESYLPVQFSTDLRKLMDAKRGAASGSLVKQRRVFVSGGRFLGETLQGANPQQVLDHAERVASEKLGPGAVELFEKNPWKLIDRYIGGAQRFAASKGLERRLGPDRTLLAGVDTHPQVSNHARLLDLEDAGGNQAEVALRSEADDLYDAADRHALAGDHEAAAHLSLEAAALHEAADFAPIPLERVTAELPNVPVTDMALAALRVIPGDPDWVATALLALERNSAFRDSGWFTKTFDKVTNTWKAYAILSPGFHSRNFMGGVFNNALAGVDVGAYGLYAAQAKKLAHGGIAAVDEEYRAAFEAMERFGLRNSSVGRDLADVAETGGGRISDNALLRANRAGAVRVENALRGTLFLDQTLKGASVEDALDAVARYHFNYDELSPVFKQGVRRAVPFATWSRFNFPIQVEHFIRTPGKYTRYLHAMQNIEDGNPEAEGDRPPWLAALLAIRSPFLAPGGRSLYLTPDLPFRDLAETFDREKLLSQLHPLPKTLLETDRGKTYFSDNYLSDEQRKAPTPWVPVMGALYALGPVATKLGLPKIGRDEDGDFTISEKDSNKLEGPLPILGRLKRLFPSDEKSQARAFSAWLSFVGGASTQTIVEQEPTIKKASSTLRRSAEPPLRLRSATALARASSGEDTAQAMTVQEAYAMAKQQLGR